jgi:glycosyltransferase involved in cell wall biosynthesis
LKLPPLFEKTDPLEKSIKIAIVHDALVVPGGAERVAAVISQVFPDAPIFTAAYLPENTFPYFKSKEIHTLPGTSLVHNERQFKRLFPLWFLGFRRLDLSGYDLIISCSTYAAKYIKTPPGVTHICFMQSPFRFLWRRESYSPESLPYKGLAIRLIDWILPLLRKIDRHYTNQITQLVANSQNMAKFIQKVYHREAQVIYPPIDINQYILSSEKKDYYLFVGRLLSYKRADLAIQACEQSKRQLIVVGEGPEYESLKKLAGSETTFLGKASDNDLKKLYSEARGLIFPGMDDFGLVPIEAQASGCPVIAFRAGGALETVIENETGVFFDAQTVNDLLAALDHFEHTQFDLNIIRQNAIRFDTSTFIEKMHLLVSKTLS